MSAAPLTARGVGLDVGERTLVTTLELDVDTGEVLAVLGPNGAGKSTLLRALAGLQAPARGQVLLDGRRIEDLPGRERARRLAYLPQLTPLYVDLAVAELVMLGRAPHLPRFAAPSDEDRGHVHEALARVGLEGFARRPLSTLSGGERQRANLARLLCSGAPVLVLDEPTTALDVGHTLGFLDLLRRLASEGATIVLAMHELELARRHADRGLLLDGAGGVEAGPIDHVASPERLGPVFGVEAELGEALVFRRKR